jgi:tetratricopeptide (TPR) repeat protein
MKKLVLILAVVAGLATAVYLANQAVKREDEYFHFIAQGEEALRRGETFVAIEAYSGAIALKHDSMLAYLKRGEAHQRRGDTPEMLAAALRDLRTAAQLGPTSTQALEKLGDVNFQLRRFANAAENYESYLRLDDQSATVLYKLGLASRSDGRLTRAISALQQAVKLNPAFHEAHYLLGLCMKDREQLAEARASLDRAVEISPAFIPAREELADLHRLQGRMREEIDQLEALSALDPAKVERLIAVGLAHWRAGHREMAIGKLGQAAERFKDHPNVYTAVGEVWLDAAEGSGDRTEVRKALEALEPIATQASATSETLGLYGRALVLADRHAEAEQFFRRAAERFPTDPEVLPHYASVAQHQGHLAEARQALLRYTILADEDRHDAENAARIGDLSLQLNDTAAAIVWYEKSAAVAAPDAALLTRLAGAQAKAGHLVDARATLHRALEKEPTHPAALALARRLQTR